MYSTARMAPGSIRPGLMSSTVPCVRRYRYPRTSCSIRAATRLAHDFGEAGADAFTIMKLMGHSTVTMSQKYVHPSPELLETAMNRLEALNQSNAQTPKRGVGANLGTMGSSDEEKNAEVA